MPAQTPEPTEHPTRNPTNVIRIDADDSPEEIERKMAEGFSGLNAILDAYRKHFA